jgi:hypothetical protein
MDTFINELARVKTIEARKQRLDLFKHFWAALLEEGNVAG